VAVSIVDRARPSGSPSSKPVSASPSESVTSATPSSLRNNSFFFVLVASERHTSRLVSAMDIPLWPPQHAGPTPLCVFFFHRVTFPLKDGLAFHSLPSLTTQSYYPLDIQSRPTRRPHRGIRPWQPGVRFRYDLVQSGPLPLTVFVNPPTNTTLNTPASIYVQRPNTSQTSRLASLVDWGMHAVTLFFVLRWILTWTDVIRCRCTGVLFF